jgi:CDP-6-deoxy-D-xylo-4-hexulose-3-dehydrase
MIKLAEKIIDEKDVSSLVDWLQKSDHFTKGEQTLIFESEWSKWIGSRYSVFVNSGSSANLLITLALLYSGRLRNKKIIVPAISWVTTVSPAMQLGMTPILCDSDKDDLGLDVEHFEKLCEEHRPSVAFLVHVLGHANKMDQLIQICKRYDVLLVEDTCEAYGSEYHSRKLGTFGIASTHSFFYGHAMSTIEGGMISTDDYELFNIMLSLRSHGWLRDNDNSYKQKILNKYDMNDPFLENYFFVYPGLNIRNTDLNAFVGIQQMRKIDNYVSKRDRNYKLYANNLSNHVWIQRSETELISALSFGLIHENRMNIAKALIQNNIECRPLICGSIQEHPFWYTRYDKVDLPNATKVHKLGLYVPCHQSMKEEQINFISDIIKDNI